MSRRCQSYSWILGAAVLLAGIPGSARAQASLAEALKKSDIVFIGTVGQVGAASFAAVPVSPRTVVVRVDAVIEKPKAVVLKQGDQVTVEVQDPSQFKVGVQATFYTDGWIYGQGIAVREVGHELAQSAMTEAAVKENRNRVMQMRKELSDADLRARIEAADMVVVGKVAEVHSWTKAGTAGPRGVSEHNPDWQEAVIQVESSLKGAQAQQSLVIRFPGSMDISWYGVPKFKQGQDGTFLLKKDRVSGAPMAMLAGAAVQAYTALNSGDVLSKDEAERVRSLVTQKAEKPRKGKKTEKP